MENASKALVIAAGVLLTLLIVSLMLYVYTSISNVSKREAEILTAEELSEFNMQFESFNKSSMYGTDIITVINKAIANNKKYPNQTIEMTLTTTEDFFTTQTYFELDSLGNYVRNNEKSTEELVIEEGTYTDADAELESFLRTINEKKETKYEDNRKTCIEIKPAISEFKNRKFKCTEVQYDSDTGKVSSMSFKQI